MSDYDNSNSGVLFKNDRKQGDNDPDYTGSWTDADNVEYFLSAWINDGRNGKYMKVKLGQQKQQQRSQPPSRPQPSRDDLGEEPPF